MAITVQAVFHEGDDGSTVTYQVMERGSALNISAGTTFQGHFKRQGKAVVTVSAAISDAPNGKFIATVPASILANAAEITTWGSFVLGVWSGSTHPGTFTVHQLGG